MKKGLKTDDGWSDGSKKWIDRIKGNGLSLKDQPKWNGENEEDVLYI